MVWPPCEVHLSTLLVDIQGFQTRHNANYSTVSLHEFPVLLRVSVAVLVLLHLSYADDVGGKGQGVYVIN